MIKELTKPSGYRIPNIFRDQFVEEIQNSNKFNGGTQLSDEELNLETKRQEIKQRDDKFRQELKKTDLDMSLKKSVSIIVFTYLAIETGLVFLIVTWQGLTAWGFDLHDTTLNIFVAATIAQISGMAVIITRHLFPTEKQNSG